MPQVIFCPALTGPTPSGVPAQVHTEYVQLTFHLFL